MTKEQHIDAFNNTLLSNYDMPEEFTKDLAEFLYDEGYRLECFSTWVYDEYLDDIVCCACNESAQGRRTNFCPHCGARQSGGKS